MKLKMDNRRFFFCKNINIKEINTLQISNKPRQVFYPEITLRKDTMSASRPLSVYYSFEVQRCNVFGKGARFRNVPVILAMKWSTSRLVPRALNMAPNVHS
jgi:hypothetical protein